MTRNEIEGRNIDKISCSSIANHAIDALMSKYKLRLCQRLAGFHYRGEYEKFKRTLDKIQESGFADEECIDMADFYMIKITRKQEKQQAISSAIEKLYGRGSSGNPIYIRLQ